MQEFTLSFGEWLGPYSDEFRTAMRVLVFIALAAIANRLVGKLLGRFFRSLGGRANAIEERRRIETVAKVATRTATLVIVAVAAMTVLNQLGIAIAPILGAAGVVGIAVGFGAQSLIKDVFGGLVLLIENQIRVGDSVQIVGLSGTVEEISLRRVKLRGYDGSIHYVSNGLITTVTNRSTDFAYAIIDLEVPYSEDVDRVLALMTSTAQALQSDPDYAGRVQGEFELVGIEPVAAANLVHSRIRTKALQQAGVRREFLRRLQAACEHEGIRIPFPDDLLPAAHPETER
ncbi:MAG TPA: mechanosensitive ion channel family protein [Burkholderiaceae bacterium]|nr:mechanosensitive ion channel family protein [Burkholderiaceae bacterium]